MVCPHSYPMDMTGSTCKMPEDCPRQPANIVLAYVNLSLPPRDLLREEDNPSELIGGTTSGATYGNTDSKDIEDRKSPDHNGFLVVSPTRAVSAINP